MRVRKILYYLKFGHHYFSPNFNADISENFSIFSQKATKDLACHLMMIIISHIESTWKYWAFDKFHTLNIKSLVNLANRSEFAKLYSPILVNFDMVNLPNFYLPTCFAW